MTKLTDEELLSLRNRNANGWIVAPQAAVEIMELRERVRYLETVIAKATNRNGTCVWGTKADSTHTCHNTELCEMAYHLGLRGVK